MRNTFRIFLIVLVAALMSTACSEKIDLKIKNAPPGLVIEGNLNDQAGPYYVLISKSKLFTDNNSFTGVPAAVVVISDDAGNSDTLTESIAGLYQTNTMQGIVGRTYHLRVTAEGTTYDSYCKMQSPVDIDSIALSTETGFRGDVKKVANILVQDPGAVPNYYRVMSILNGGISTGFDIHRDRLWDGKLRSFGVPHSDFHSGDTLQVNLLSIDEHLYNYFAEFNDNQNNFGAPAAPANPDPVFTPAALGYFSAHSIKSKTVIIP